MRRSGDDSRAEVRRLLGLVVSAPARFPALSSSEQDLALRVARRARLLGRLAASLEEAGGLDELPMVVADQLHSAQIMVDARKRLALWELDRIAWAVGDDDELPLVAMKGCAYLLLDLPNSRGRVFADVDLMTNEDALEELETRLDERGWRTAPLTPYDDNYYRRWTHELPPLTHETREIEVDLHHNILPRTARLKPDGSALMQRSRALAGSRYRVLADEDMVLHAMTHLIVADDLADKLRELVDIADLLDYFSSRDTAFWDRLVLRAGELDLQRPAFYALRYAHRLLGTGIPETVLLESRAWAPPGFVVALMDRLVPRALYPQHPDEHSRVTEFARFVLYLRSHWIRMPPWLLGYHLAYKFMVTRLGRGKKPDSP
ncbi:nucleotidyltransferase domain-containing protein [Lentisalinibacter salinarum]|uniref:nucleotidyltransferase domain-containing protein n=1 Tax=Lentisalinibacter salinarum TaxID=2992239 RepID=UPI003863D835